MLRCTSGLLSFMKKGASANQHLLKWQGCQIKSPVRYFADEIDATKESFQIKQATIEDKQAVLDINNNVYKGYDYLKALYEDEFINSHNTKAYVAVCKDQIAAFGAVTVVDDGQTAVIRAGRVNNRVIKKGLIREIRRHALINSGATFEALTTGDSNTVIKSRPFQQKNYRLVLKLIFMAFNISLEDPSLKQSIVYGPNKLLELTQPLLQEYFETDEYRKYLFSKERIVINCLPYRIMSSNIPLLWKRSEDCHRVTDLRREDGVVRGLVSVLTTYIGMNGVLVGAFDVFGTDIDSLKHHIVSHVEYLRNLNKTHTALYISCDLELGYENVEKVFSEFGLTKTLFNPFDSPSYKRNVYLYERCTLSGI